MINKKIRTLFFLCSFMLVNFLVVKADDNNVKKYLDQALKEKSFYHYNIAYNEIMKIKDESVRNNYIVNLAAIINDVWSEDIKYINNLLKSVVDTGSGRVYAEAESYMYKANIKAIDRDYLLGELTSWGKDLVWTEEYKVAMDALSNAWTNKDKASITQAENLINKMYNKYSKDYLNEELANLKNSLVLDNINILKEFKEIKLSDASREDKMLALNKFFNKNIELILPQNYMLSIEGYRLLDYLMECKIPETIGELQKNINIAIAKNEGFKFKGVSESKYSFIEIDCNNGQDDYDVTDKLIIVTDSLLKGTTYKIVSVGKKDNIDYKSSNFLNLREEKILLKPRKIVFEQYDTVCVETTYKNQSYTTEINVKIIPVEENDIIKKLKYIQQDNVLTEDEKLYQLNIILSNQDKIIIPENYMLSAQGYNLVRFLASRVPDTIDELQMAIDNVIVGGEAEKYVAWFAWMKGYPEYRANNGGVPIDITDDVFKLKSPLLKDTKVEIESVGWKYPNRAFEVAQYISLVNGRIYLVVRPYDYNNNNDCFYESVNIKVTYRGSTTLTNLWVKIIP